MRIDELEHLYDFDVADERTVAALERLMVEPQWPARVSRGAAGHRHS